MTHKVWLWIDPTRRCNLKCTLCYTKASHASEDLSSESFQYIIENIESDTTLDVQQLTLNWRGEPLMNPQFVDLLYVLSRRSPHYDIQFHTNATLLRPALVDALMHVPLHYTIYVSIDGGSEASHDLHRGKGTYKKSMAGAWMLLKARGERTTPRIALYQLDLREEARYYDPEFLELSEAVDEFQRAVPVLPNGDGRTMLEAEEHPSGSPLVTAWMDVPMYRPVPHDPCFWAGNSLCVAPSGDVHICLLSHTSDGCIGNLLREPAGIVFERSRRFRKSIELTGRPSIPHCRDCRKCPGNAS